MVRPCHYHTYYKHQIDWYFLIDKSFKGEYFQKNHTNFSSFFFQHFGYNEIPHRYNQISPQYLEDSYPAAAHQRVHSAVYPQKTILHSGGFKPIFKPRVSSGMLGCMMSLNLHRYS